MRRVLFSILTSVGVLGALAGAYFGGFLDAYLPAAVIAEPAAAPLQAPPAQETPPEPFVDQIVVDARVSPVDEAELSLPVSGIVADILVEEGDLVEKGDVLLRLNAAQQRTAVSRAQADLQRAQARLDQLVAGARPEEIESVRAALDAAQAQLDRLETGAIPGQTAEAEAGLAVAQAALQKVQEGASDQTLIAARADLANAEAELRRAQRAFDQIKWRNDSGATQESAALQTATNNYEAAQARLADLEAGATAADIAGAQAQVAQAKARLDLLKLTSPSDLVAAQAAVRQAQAQLDLSEAGARPEEIASAEADVAAATAALQQALVSLADTELRAPFSGSVAVLETAVGEQAAAGTPIARLADLSTWEVRTEDLTELDIVQIEVGAPVQLTFDAIPDLELPGTVTRIRPVGADRRGDIVYTVVIEPTRTDDRLRWNMTAVATFGAP